MASLLRWTIKDLCEVIEGCVNNKFDVIMFVEGNRGLGKSTFLYKVGLRLNTHGVVKFNPQQDITYSREDTIKRLASKTKEFIFADELINVAYNRDFYETDQKVLLKALNMYRDSCNVFGGAIPKFMDLDNQIRRLCKIRITIVRRGIAIVHTQLRGIYRDDPWDTRENMKMEMSKTMQGKATPYAKLSTSRGLLYFTDLTEQQRSTYEGIKQDKRGQVYKEYTDTNPDPEAQFYDKLLNEIIKGRMDNDKMFSVCRMFNKKFETVKANLRRKLRDDPENKDKNLKELLQKPIEKNKKPRILISNKNLVDDQRSPESHNNNLMGKPNEELWN